MALVLSACGESKQLRTTESNSAAFNNSVNILIKSSNTDITITNGDIETVKLSKSNRSVESGENNDYCISLVLTEEGKEKLSQITKDRGNHSTFYLDGQVISQPTIVAQITDGTFVFLTCDTLSEAQEYFDKFTK